MRLEGPTSCSLAPGHPNHRLTPSLPRRLLFLPRPLPPPLFPPENLFCSHDSETPGLHPLPPTSHVGSCRASHMWGWKQNLQSFLQPSTFAAPSLSWGRVSPGGLGSCPLPPPSTSHPTRCLVLLLGPQQLLTPPCLLHPQPHGLSSSCSCQRCFQRVLRPGPASLKSTPAPQFTWN